MVHGKRKVASFKTKKMRQVDPEDWIIVKNTHTPIIDEYTWDRVRERLGCNHKKIRRTKDNTVGLFSGILRCADCGTPLAHMRKRLKTVKKVFIVAAGIITTEAMLVHHIILMKNA